MVSRPGCCASARLCTFLLATVAIAGCGGGKDEIPLLPVSGFVKSGGTPLPMGTVDFHPDAGKGNTFTGIPKGMIKSDGAYAINTDGRPGAPAGWYKVSVSAMGMPDPSKMTEGTKAPTPPTINAKYNKPDTSGLVFEVKDGAAAGTYDLSLVK